MTIGYRVALTNKSTGNDAVGRVIGSEVTTPQVSYNPPNSLLPPGEWQDCEVRAEQGTLTIRINGSLVNTVGNVDELTGYIGLQQRRGKVEFRRAQVTTLPPSKEPFGLGAFTLKGTSIVPPRVVKEVRPFYPRAPFESGVEGTVLVEAVVDASGSVGDVRVVKSLDPDLDQAAIAAARRWEFAPATDAGKPVPVIVTLEMSFLIRQ
jgi:TonB family protein